MPLSQVHHIFCDESCHTQNRYMVLGGIIVHQSALESFNTTMAASRETHNMKSELKWSKVSHQKINEYKHFIDYFFALNNSGKAHFKSVIIDNSQANHRKYNNGDTELGLNKFMYQLLLNSFGGYCTNVNKDKFVVHLDERPSDDSLLNLKNALNNGMSKSKGITHRPFSQVRAINSKHSNVMQINDILIGSIGFQKNGRHLLTDSAKAKIELAEYVRHHSGLKTLMDNSPIISKRFGVWNFRMALNAK